MKKLWILALLTLTGVIPCESQTLRRSWDLTGTVVDTLEVPGSGGAWAITIRSNHPEISGAEQFLSLWCDHEQVVTQECAALQLFERIRVAGHVLSNEPSSGQRLSVRRISVANDDVFSDGFETGDLSSWGAKCSELSIKEVMSDIPKCSAPSTDVCDPCGCTSEGNASVCVCGACTCGFGCSDSAQGPCSMWAGLCFDPQAQKIPGMTTAEDNSFGAAL